MSSIKKRVIGIEKTGLDQQLNVRFSRELIFFIEKACKRYPDDYSGTSEFIRGAVVRELRRAGIIGESFPFFTVENTKRRKK
jgi:hypothetical protein